MITPTVSAIADMINSPVRRIRARVELLEGSALVNTFSCNSNLISFEIQRVGEGKFYGYGICARLNLKLMDKDRELNITTANSLEIVWGCEQDINYLYTLPLFNVTEVHRDENTNELSVTAYDWLYQATNHTTAELNLSAYTIKEAAKEAAAKIGLNVRLDALEDDAAFNTFYENGANLDGTETLRELLDDIAEATQTIYYVNNEWELVFKRLDIVGAAALTVDREKYFTLSSKTNRKLKTVCHATELGDNVSASISENGSTQYVRNNAFYELREDVADLVNLAIDNVGGLTINQFEMEWRGNYLLEMGDKIALITKDGETAYSYLLDDTLTYDGTLSQQTRWSYAADEAETESNPTNLGDAIKQTYAKVDKANREIELVASETAANGESLSSLLINTESIAATVESVEATTTTALSEVNEEIATLTNKVETAITAEDVRISIQTELSNGVDKVVTSTGYTFDENGLMVSKSDSEMKTQISDDGMIVFKSDEAVLTANNEGVDAVNLRATTYLIIGTNSRLENYGDNRTGCFWIGEVSS